MEEVEARVAETRRSSEGLYDAVLVVKYRGREYSIRVSRLLREPGHVSVRRSGDYLLVEMMDRDRLPLATCCIHVGHLEKGCTDCPSLLVPPKGGEEAGP